MRHLIPIVLVSIKVVPILERIRVGVRIGIPWPLLLFGCHLSLEFEVWKIQMEFHRFRFAMLHVTSSPRGASFTPPTQISLVATPYFSLGCHLLILDSPVWILISTTGAGFVVDRAGRRHSRQTDKVRVSCSAISPLKKPYFSIFVFDISIFDL